MPTEQPEIKKLFARQIAHSMAAIEDAQIRFAFHESGTQEVKRQVKAYFWGLYDDLCAEMAGEPRS